VPLPLVPLIDGSSQWCRAALATTGRLGWPQNPAPRSSPRSAAHLRGQRLQIMVIALSVVFCYCTEKRGKIQEPLPFAEFWLIMGKRQRKGDGAMEKQATEVVAALIWEGDRFMACQRPAHKARGLLWEFVGGKVEPGETPEEALRRECREELNVEIRVEELFMEVTHHYPDLLVHLRLYNAAIVSGTPEKLEHNDIRFITVEEIDDYAFCPADTEILERLKAL